MHYLDHAATTPVLPEVREIVLGALEDDFGNPSSVHAYGRRARELVEDGRDRVAVAIGASPAEVEGRRQRPVVLPFTGASDSTTGYILVGLGLIAAGALLVRPRRKVTDES